MKYQHNAGYRISELTGSERLAKQANANCRLSFCLVSDV